MKILHISLFFCTFAPQIIISMKKYIIMAEEGEQSLLEKARAELGLDTSDATSANFDLGTWVEVTEVRLNHPNVTYEEPQLTLCTRDDIRCTKAVCYSNCDFVLASEYRDCVFDMELAFIAALGFRHLHSLKYVSDNLSLHSYHELTHGVE